MSGSRSDAPLSTGGHRVECYIKTGGKGGARLEKPDCLSYNGTGNEWKGSYAAIRHKDI